MAAFIVIHIIISVYYQPNICSVKSLNEHQKECETLIKKSTKINGMSRVWHKEEKPTIQREKS